MVSKATPYRDTKAWLTPKEVATLLKYKRTDPVYTLIDAGEFTEVLDRGPPGNPSYLISPESVAAFQRRRMKQCKRPEQAPPETQYPAGVDRY